MSSDITQDALVEAFKVVDSNGDNLIDRTEVRELLRTSFPEKSEQMVNELVNIVMSKADTDGDGFVDVTEYIASVERGDGVLPATVAILEEQPTLSDLEGILTRQELLFMHYCFATLDANGDGHITSNELRTVITEELKSCPTITPIIIDSIVNATIRNADLNTDGAISKAEFVAAFVRGFPVVSSQYLREISSNLVRNLSADEVLILQRTFKIFDIDGDGHLNISELEALFHKILKYPTEKCTEAAKLTLQTSDLDSDGMLSLVEFLRSYAEDHRVLPDILSSDSAVEDVIPTRTPLSLSCKQYQFLINALTSVEDESPMQSTIEDLLVKIELGLSEASHDALRQVVVTEVSYHTNQSGVVIVKDLIASLLKNKIIEVPQSVKSDLIELRRELVLAFAKLDSNGDGFLDHSEMHPVLCKLVSDRMSVEENEAATIADELLSKADLNGDGLLSIDEFLTSFSSSDGVTLIPYSFAQKLAAVGRLPSGSNDEMSSHMAILKQNQLSTEYLFSEEELRQILSDCLSGTSSPVDEVLSLLLSADQNTQGRQDKLFSIASFLRLFALSKELDSWIANRQGTQQTPTFHYKLNHILNCDSHYQATIAIFNPILTSASDDQGLSLEEYLKKNIHPGIELDVQNEVIRMIIDVFGAGTDLREIATLFGKAYQPVTGSNIDFTEGLALSEIYCLQHMFDGKGPPPIEPDQQEAFIASHVPQAMPVLLRADFIKATCEIVQQYHGEEIEKDFSSYFSCWFNSCRRQFSCPNESIVKDSELYIRILHCFDGRDPCPGSDVSYFLEDVIDSCFSDTDENTKYKIYCFITATAGYVLDDVVHTTADELLSRFRTKMEITKSPSTDLKEVCVQDGIYRSVLHTLAGYLLTEVCKDETTLMYLQRVLEDISKNICKDVIAVVISCVDHADSLRMAVDFVPACRQVFLSSIMSDISIHNNELLHLCDNDRSLYQRIRTTLHNITQSEETSEFVELLDFLLINYFPNNVDIRQRAVSSILHSVQYDDDLPLSVAVDRLRYMYPQTGIPNLVENKSKLLGILSRVSDLDLDRQYEEITHMFDSLNTQESVPTDPIGLINNLLLKLIESVEDRKEVMKVIFSITDTPESFDSFHQYVCAFRDLFDVTPYCIPTSKLQRILSEYDYRSIMHVFDCLDTNRDGFLDKEELSNTITKILSDVKPPLHNTPSQISSILSSIVEVNDLNHDGKISLDEFIQSFQKTCSSVIPIEFIRKERNRLAKKLTKDEIIGLKSTFRDLDKNSDGFLDQQELLEIISTIVGSERAVQLVEEITCDGSTLTMTQFFKSFAKDEGIGAMIPFIYAQKIADAEVLLSFVISSLSFDQKQYIINNPDKLWNPTALAEFLCVDSNAVNKPNCLYSYLVSFSDGGMEINGHFTFNDLSFQLLREKQTVAFLEQINEKISTGTELLIKAFSEVDKNKSGDLDREEITEVVKEVMLSQQSNNETSTAVTTDAVGEIVSLIMKICDTNSDGKIDFGEFITAHNNFSSKRACLPDASRVDCESPHCDVRNISISLLSLSGSEIALLCRALGPVSDAIDVELVINKIIELSTSQENDSLVRYLRSLVPGCVDPFGFMADVKKLFEAKDPNHLIKLLTKTFSFSSLSKLVSGLQTAETDSVCEIVPKIFPENPFFITTVLTSQSLDVLIPELERTQLELMKLLSSTASEVCSYFFKFVDRRQRKQTQNRLPH